MIYDHIGGIRDPLQQDLELKFRRNQNKFFSILTENHINHDQIHHIKNKWLGSIFFTLGDSHTKECLSCYIWDLKVDSDPKGKFVSFRFTTSNDRVVCVYSPSRYAPGNSCIRGVSLKDYKITWKRKIRETETK